jgi:hypothetical protein
MAILDGQAYRGYNADDFKRYLSAEELEECTSIGHWLFVEQALRDSLSTRVRMNTFLTALWLAKPTRTQVAFRLEEIDGGLRSARRVLDRFQWVEGYVADELDAKDLDRTGSTLPQLLEIYLRARRLRNALVLTFRACVSSDWQSSYVCFAAAVEALLVHPGKHGLVHRLADAYSRLTASSDTERKAQQDHFKYLYSVRSRIMHGRAHDRRTGEANLKDLAAMSDVVRGLWDRVLDFEDIRNGLEGDDSDRVNLFNDL